MIRMMDNLFIAAGLEAKEVKASPMRGVLYLGMIFMLGLTTTFTALIILG